MSLPPSPHCHSPASASAPATSPGSAPDPGLCICSTIQHYDDFPARAAQRAADQHQPAAEQHTARHRRGHLHTGPTDPVSRQPPNLILKQKMSSMILGCNLVFFPPVPFSPFHSLQVPSRAAAGDQACDSSNGMWSSHGAHFHVHGTGGHCVQPLWWATGKDKAV